MTVLWLKGFHVIGLILWMGGLFALTSHLGTSAGVEPSQRTDAMEAFERKTYYFSALPGLILSLVTGLWLMVQNGFGFYLNVDGAWGATFHAKLTLIVLLIGIDQFVHFKMRRFHASGEGNRGLFMALHGTIGLMFIIIPILVQTKLLA
jgi:putative membrane protein